jgi:hypothetical protein
MDTESMGMVGDPILLDHISLIKPQYHVFGHVHATYGINRWESSEVHKWASTRSSSLLSCNAGGGDESNPMISNGNTSTATPTTAKAEKSDHDVIFVNASTLSHKSGLNLPIMFKVTPHA